MINQHYQQQLHNLRELAREFSATYPAVAPFLSGESRDPDVERLLEGVAFLSGLLRAKVDDEFPELIHSLTNIIFPHLLRPVPSLSVVQFTPKPNQIEPFLVVKGTTLASRSVAGEPCQFRTCSNLEVHPIQMISRAWQQSATAPPELHLELALSGLPLAQWQPKELAFFLGGDLAQATNLFYLLSHQLAEIQVSTDNGISQILPLEAFHAQGFLPENALFPYPRQAFQGYRGLQEYFALPQKFLFFRLTGWERWNSRGAGSRFTLKFRLKKGADIRLELPELNEQSLILGAVPVINLFKLAAEPLRFDLTRPRVRVNPSQRKPEAFSVYSVDKVVGFTRGTVNQNFYQQVDSFRSNTQTGAVYQIVRRRSQIHDRLETFLEFAYTGQGAELIDETLAVDLTCTNGRLPEQLQLGDICVETADSPGLLNFKNITVPTSPVEPPIGHDELWRFMSHLSLNLLSIADVESLRSLLQVYLFSQDRDKPKLAAMQKRLDGLVDFRSVTQDRIVRGVMMRGQQLRLQVRHDSFASPGDICLFGSVLDQFFSEYCSFNCFTEFVIQDLDSGEEYRWPARLGNRPLL